MKWVNEIKMHGCTKPGRSRDCRLARKRAKRRFRHSVKRKEEREWKAGAEVVR